MLNVRARLKRDGTRAETRFSLSAKRTSPFKSAGASVQSTAGSRGVRIRGSTVIPRLTKIIRSGITFVSRNTHTDGKDKLLEWPDRSCLLLYVSALIH